MPKMVVVILLTVVLIVLGFLIGASVGARFLVPEGSGLAGGPMVLGYGILGSGLGLVIAIILSMKLDQPRMVQLTLLSTGACIVIWSLIYVDFRKREAQRAADNPPTQQDPPTTPKEPTSVPDASQP